MSAVVQYVRVPRAVVGEWQHATWAELVAAAETKIDGISAEAPYFVQPRTRPEARNYQDPKLFAKEAAGWDRMQDAAYFRQCDGARHAHQACLYQQNWEAPNSWRPKLLDLDAVATSR